ncbi:MAG TPA: 3-hydroxyisobutyrate dehydrogenase [Acetobacteraceae bacterium]|nr:3-hydroxyisobutyrate dehydrogenase [Acetobacteraceae bacterium]
MAKIGFVGLGNMGGPMAANLIKAGHEVTGYDVVAAARDAAAQAGARIAPTLADVARGADIVITMLPNGALVLQCLGGADGLLAHAAPGTLFIDSSTIDVADARAAHAAAAQAGMRALDAPVSGGTGGAAAGTLTFMAGGSAEAFAQAQPVLAAMGRKIVHCGEAGAGQAAKICNNMILGISMIAVGEAFVLGEKLGLSHQALFDVASTSSGQCWALSSNCPVPGPVPASPANRDYRPGFATALMLKDLLLSQACAEKFGAKTSLGALATQLYESYAATGGATTDFSGIINAIRGGSV